MSVRIRFKRTGRRNLPSYRIGVFESRTRRDGPALEILGWYNPLNDEGGKGFRVDAERLHDWLGRGARMTDPVRSLLIRQGVELGDHARDASLKGGHRRPKKPGTPRTDRQKKRLEAIGRKRKKRASRRAALQKKAAAKAGA